MKIKLIAPKSKYIALVAVLIIALFSSSCQKHRYKRMVKKRRAGTMKKKRYRGEYQRKLRKHTLSVQSPYYIKQKKNYKRRPWYDGK